jgi:hypothetical protein
MFCPGPYLQTLARFFTVLERIFKERIFTIIIGIFMTLPLLGLGFQISKCSPKLVKKCNYAESKFLEFFVNKVFICKKAAP